MKMGRKPVRVTRTVSPTRRVPAKRQRKRSGKGGRIGSVLSLFQGNGRVGCAGRRPASPRRGRKGDIQQREVDRTYTARAGWRGRRNRVSTAAPCQPCGSAGAREPAGSRRAHLCLDRFRVPCTARTALDRKCPAPAPRPRVRTAVRHQSDDSVRIQIQIHVQI